MESNNPPVHPTPVGSAATSLPCTPAQHVNTSVPSVVTLEPLPAKPNLIIVPGIMAQPFNTTVSSDVTPEIITSQSNPSVVQNILAEPVHTSVSTVATLALLPSTAQPIHTHVSTVCPMPQSAPQPKTSTVATLASHAVTMTTLAEHYGKLHLPPPLPTKSSKPHVS